ncbi:hypothetical protein [Bradyrhizobium sp.]|uniref:hypothetical protein n=1 Tax=Bradyrhizobium sp. TaxID=376 RepID=UPI0025C1DE55|nr:hypothetical protein [Bradyrhizobium sp.]
MLKYLKKFAVDIFPSVAATVIGAYIVNHYIVSKPATNTPAASVAAKGRADTSATPAETAAEVSNLPAAGVKARGISEKALMERTAAERPAVAEKIHEKPQDKAEPRLDAKSAASPAETASIPAEPRRQPVAPREREKIRVVLPSPVQPSPSAAAPVASPAAESVPDERRDANELARAAIERLRGNADHSPRMPEPARPPDVSRVVAAPPAAAPVPRPLPPPILVATPPTGELPGQPSSQARPPLAATPGAADRPTPPAEIPSRPLDLRAEVAEPSVRERGTAVAEEVMSTAKSLFQAVLPK